MNLVALNIKPWKYDKRRQAPTTSRNAFDCSDQVSLRAGAPRDLLHLLIGDGGPVTFSSSVCKTLFAAQSSVPSGGELDSIDKSRSVARLGVLATKTELLGLLLT